MKPARDPDELDATTNGAAEVGSGQSAPGTAPGKAQKKRGRWRRFQTPLIVTGSLLAALGLTALSDTEAQANFGDPRDHTQLADSTDRTELRILDWALWHVSKYYVEPDRIDPGRMTLAGVEALENAIPEVLVKPSADNSQVVVWVGTQSETFDIDVDALWGVGPSIRDVFRFVADNADLDQDERTSAEYSVVEAVLHTLDPHTNLLRPEAFEDMKASTRGSFGGLGIEIGMRDGALTIIRVIDGNPAAKEGLLAGDRIVQIEEESTVTMDSNDAVTRLRGAPGTKVTIYVRREGLAQPKKFTITRDTITLDSVIGDVLPGPNGTKVGLVQIPRNFSQNTAKELQDQLEKFEQEQVSGVVLDMRDNPGGLLTAAVDVADAFLSAGTIVSTVGASSPREVSDATRRYDFPDLPLVVLVDQGSASATEIVAGALRNRDRAVILGRRTFGKGSVQVLHDRRVGSEELALKLTIAQYLTPGDVSIQSVGVGPDLETIPVWIGEEHTAFFGTKRFDLLREESLSAHLENGTAKQQKITAGPLHFLQQGSLGSTDDTRSNLGIDEKAEKRTEMLLRDPEVRMARDLVLAAPSSDRNEMLAMLPEFTQNQATTEATRIARALSKRGVDWTPGPPPPEGTAPKLRARLSMDRSDNAIKGGESGQLTLTVTNEGDAPAYQVRAFSDSDYAYFDERELILGKIDPGQTRTASLKLSVSEHELTRTDRIDMHLFERHHERPIQSTHIDVSAKGLPRPAFAFGYQVLDDPSFGDNIVGNGDGALQVGERVKLRVEVRNDGEGPALDTWVHLRNLSAEPVFIHDGRKGLENMNVGTTRVVELDFEVKSRPARGEAEVQLTVSDNKIGEFVSDKLVFPIQDNPKKFSDEVSGMVATSDVILVSDPYRNAATVATVKSGTKLRVKGSAGNWLRVDLGDRFGFVKKGEFKQAKAPRKSGRVNDVLTVSPPKVNLVGIVSQTEDEQIHVSGTITDDQAVRDVYITVINPSRDIFGNREKVFYKASTNPESGQLEFAADIPLTPGNNLIEVYARENDDVIGSERLWVLRTSGLAEARAEKGNFKSDGSLSVDTFQN